MPTMADLASIATAIYDGNPSISTYEGSPGLTYTRGTATALGLPEPYFCLWSGEEGSSSGAYKRSFKTESSSVTNNDREDRNNRIQAICIN
jgi:hypothetical protein